MMRNGNSPDDFLERMGMGFCESGVQYEDTVSNIREFIKRNSHVAPHNKPRIFQRGIYLELCKLFDSGKPSFTPRKGKTSVVMFLGLEGSGKTTTCTKYAHYHHNKGWKPALVRTGGGAFDHLEENAKVQIPSFGSYVESDAVRVAVQGVEKFKKENRDLIIVDTSRRHKQETALFDEMHHISEAIKPDLVILVLDSNMGPDAFGQAQAFKQKVVAGAVILTKMDGHAASGGALSAVAAAKAPVIFTETGENMDEFEFFDLKPFVRRLLGMGDNSGLINFVQEVVPPVDQQPKHMLGPMGQIFSKLPACSHKLMPTPTPTPPPLPMPMHIPLELEKERREKFKRCMTVLGSMTEEELRGLPLNASRIERIARGSGCRVRNIMEMLEDVKHMASCLKEGINPFLIQ